MQKIISLFKRDYEGDRLVHDEIVPGAEWVIEGEGVATVKYDGTCCMVRDGRLFKRYDRKLTKTNARRLKRDTAYVPDISDYKPAPEGWEAAEPKPNIHTDHWPGWLLVSRDAPEDRWHREAWKTVLPFSEDGTYELVGPKIQGNPYKLETHNLWRHGEKEIDSAKLTRTFQGIRRYLDYRATEGIVWHHPDGRMVKIKRRDFGFSWPPCEGGR